jgi:hypothetical protein
VPTIFYSWQSDRAGRENRFFIKEALEAAITDLNAEVNDADRPDEQVQLDHDTKGLPGSPDITASILAKIEVADLFVADVTPIAVAERVDGRVPRQVANPNVLIELGYAKRAIGPEKIIQIWNTAYTDCRPEDLPFDMRGRRGPISYRLEAHASKESRRDALASLVRALKPAIATTLRATARPVAPDRWQPSDDADPSIWPTDSGAMTVNEPPHGSGIKRVFPPPRACARILPRSWQGSDDIDCHDVLLGSSGGFSWGATRGGIVTYPGTVMLPNLEKIQAVTKRFPQTGEVWATKTGISGEHRGTQYIYGDDIIRDWADFLRHQSKLMHDGGAELPLDVRLGIVGMTGLHWPGDETFGRPTIALEDRFECSFTLSTADGQEIFDRVLEIWIKLRKVFSEGEPSLPQKQSLMMRLR